MGEDSIVPKAKKAVGSQPFVAIIALILGAGGASAVTITFGDETDQTNATTTYEVKEIKKVQEKHEERIKQNETGMITVRISLEGMKMEMENQTEKIDDIKEAVERIDERSRHRRRDRDQ